MLAGVRDDVDTEFMAVHLVHRKSHAIDGDAAFRRGARAAGNSNPHRVEPFSGVADSVFANPSTWPETRCPPSSSPSLSEVSRLSLVPSCQFPSVVRESVSAETSTANQSGPASTTVRQQPEQPIEA